MKIILKIFACILIFGCASSGNISKTEKDDSKLYVLYSLKTELFFDENTDKDWQIAAKKAMDKISYYELITNNTESTFKYVEKIDNRQDHDEFSSYTIDLEMKTTVYKNLVENYSLMEIETNEKILLKDSLNVFDWTLTNETKNILGYEVRKAKSVDNRQNDITAWYVPKLPYKNGPLFYGGLPGLILELEVKEKAGKTIFIAQEIKTVKRKIEKPKKGKEMWLNDFLNMQEKQMEEMREMHRGGVDKD